jgi:hypothetical protein
MERFELRFIPVRDSDGVPTSEEVGKLVMWSALWMAWPLLVSHVAVGDELAARMRAAFAALEKAEREKRPWEAYRAACEVWGCSKRIVEKLNAQD